MRFRRYKSRYNRYCIPFFWTNVYYIFFANRKQYYDNFKNNAQALSEIFHYVLIKQRIDSLRITSSHWSQSQPHRQFSCVITRVKFRRVLSIIMKILFLCILLSLTFAANAKLGDRLKKRFKRARDPVSEALLTICQNCFNNGNIYDV